MSKIIRLAISNMLRITAAEVTPTGALVIVAGQNDQGKSSLLNCIAMALSGKETAERPIHGDATKGQIILQTEDITVTRSFSAAGGGKLEVRDSAGAPVTSPQAKLDALVSKVTFDPYEFTRMDPPEQLETLRKITGLDFTALEAEHATKYALRTEHNRRAKTQEGLLSTIKRADAPAQEISIAELTAKLRAAQDKNKANEAERERLSDFNDSVDAYAQDVLDADNEVLRLTGLLAKAKEHARSVVDSHTHAIADRNIHKEKIQNLADEPTEAIFAEMNAAEKTNAQVRENARWNQEHKNLLSIQSVSDELTARLKAIEDEKETKLKAAKFPVEGLGFTDSGVTFNGMPFEQAGTAVKIRTSVAIARSLNPKLPVMLIRDGSLLDENSLALLNKEAEEQGLQIWMECVGNREDATVIIEDGAVVATPTATNAKKKK